MNSITFRLACTLSLVSLMFTPLAADAQIADGTVLPGDLIKSESSSAVYFYYGNRYAFPNEDVYFSWFDDFSEVKTVSDAFLASVPLAANMKFKPTTFLLKIQSDPKVYYYDRDGFLRWVPTEADAAGLKGLDWAKQVRDVDVALFLDYKIGATYDRSEYSFSSGIETPTESIFKTVDDEPRPFSSPEYLRPPEVSEPLQIQRYSFSAEVAGPVEPTVAFYESRLFSQGFVKTAQFDFFGTTRSYMRSSPPELRTLYTLGNEIASVFTYGYMPVINDTVVYPQMALLQWFQDDKHTYAQSFANGSIQSVSEYYLTEAAKRGWSLERTEEETEVGVYTGETIGAERTHYFRKSGTHSWMVIRIEDAVPGYEGAPGPNLILTLTNIKTRN